MEVFEIYLKKKSAYLIFNACVIFLWVFILSLKILPNISSSISSGFIAFVILLCLSMTIFGMLIGATEIKTFEAGGEIQISVQGLTINEKKFLLSDLQMVEVTIDDYRGLGSRGGISEGTNNKIYIKTNENFIIEERFVISSKQQRDNLILIFKEWKVANFKIVLNGADLV